MLITNSLQSIHYLHAYYSFPSLSSSGASLYCHSYLHALTGCFGFPVNTPRYTFICIHIYYITILFLVICTFPHHPSITYSCLHIIPSLHYSPPFSHILSLPSSLPQLLSFPCFTSFHLSKLSLPPPSFLHSISPPSHPHGLSPSPALPSTSLLSPGGFPWISLCDAAFCDVSALFSALIFPFLFRHVSSFLHVFPCILPSYYSMSPVPDLRFSSLPFYLPVLIPILSTLLRFYRSLLHFLVSPTSARILPLPLNYVFVILSHSPLHPSILFLPLNYSQLPFLFLPSPYCLLTFRIFFSASFLPLTVSFPGFNTRVFSSSCLSVTLVVPGLLLVLLAPAPLHLLALSPRVHASCTFSWSLLLHCVDVFSRTFLHFPIALQPALLVCINFPLII